jgi:hypothetical protein
MERGTSMSEQAVPRRKPNWIAIALVAAVLVGLLFVWRHLAEQRKRDAALGAMVTAFQKQNSLSVFRAQVPVFVRNKESSLFGLLSSEQIGVIPATIEYRLDLAKLDAGSFQWNADQQQMQVTLPPLVIGEPALDARRAQLVNRGVIVTGGAALSLLSKNMDTARAGAIRESRNPQMLALARAAAREMMTQNIALPLRAAGYDNAKVSVRFADEPGDDPSFLDVAPSYNEAIAAHRRETQGQ